MDSRHSNDEFSSKIVKISNRGSRPKNSVTNKKNDCCNSIAVGGFAENRRFELFKPLFKILSGQKELKLSQTLFASAFVADKCTAIQYEFIRRREFGYKLNMSEKMDNDDKKTLQ